MNFRLFYLYAKLAIVNYPFPIANYFLIISEKSGLK